MELARSLRGIVGATVLLLATWLTDLGELIVGDPEAREPEKPEPELDDELEGLVVDCRQDPITPEAAAMLDRRSNPRPAAPKSKPLAGSIESRVARMRAF